MHLDFHLGWTWLVLPLVLLAAGPESPAADTGPRSPRESQAAFQLCDQALVIELAAAEPEVSSPVAIAWDEDGRLYVADMIDYPVAPAAGRIRQLEDRDGDGRYEHATVFADKLPFPTSVLPYSGGLLVTAAPNIWYFRDRDGDGRADLREVVLTGFGEGNTQLRANGLAVGLDNLIYVANGRSDGEVRRPGDPPEKAVSIRRRDVRFAIVPSVDAGDGIPRAGKVEAIAGFSQFGLAHDDWGNRFPSWNTVPLRHVVVEQPALDRNPFLADTSSVASILDMTDGGRVFAISPAQPRFNRESVAYFNASCGPLIERGGMLPERYRGSALVCEPLTNVVHRRVILPAGVTFSARRGEPNREFLASSDPCFRPVNLATGPDGALYVVDMYRELVEHPQFVPEPARGSVDFRRWHDRGRIWRVRPQALAGEHQRKPGLSRAGIGELVGLLRHANAWWRGTAQRLLVERLSRDRAVNNERDTAVRLLGEVLKDKANPLARLHALYTLLGSNALDSAILSEVARDSDPALREHAIRAAASLESRLHRRVLATSELLALAADASIRVRFQAALALGDRCRDEPAALDGLASIASRDGGDPWVRQAILTGLAESALAFIAACERGRPWAGRSELLTQAAAIVGVRRREPELAALFERIAARLKPPDGEQPGPPISLDSLAMLAGLADGLDRSGPPLHSLIASAPVEWKPVLSRLAPAWPAAAALAVSRQPLPGRLLAVDVLTGGCPESAETVIPELLASSQPIEMQTAAARASAWAGRPALAARALDHWSKLTMAARRELTAALAGSPLLAETLVSALESRVIAVDELDAPTRDALARPHDQALSRRVSAVLSRFVLPRRDAVIARYQTALKLAGDSQRGRAVFTRHCQTCHQHQGTGRAVGPDLSGVTGRAPDALLVDILDPNREVAPDFVIVSVATRRGQVMSGLLAEETATTVKLRRAEAVEDTILRSEIDELKATGQSLMPEGLEQSINPTDMADLLAFLREGVRASERE
jgi:putative membrane-bound dehydrogenase-like protein